MNVIASNVFQITHWPSLEARAQTYVAGSAYIFYDHPPAPPVLPEKKNTYKKLYQHITLTENSNVFYYADKPKLCEIHQLFYRFSRTVWPGFSITSWKKKKILVWLKPKNLQPYRTSTQHISLQFRHCSDVATQYFRSRNYYCSRKTNVGTRISMRNVVRRTRYLIENKIKKPF